MATAGYSRSVGRSSAVGKRRNISHPDTNMKLRLSLKEHYDELQKNNETQAVMLIDN